MYDLRKLLNDAHGVVTDVMDIGKVQASGDDLRRINHDLEDLINSPFFAAVEAMAKLVLPPEMAHAERYMGLGDEEKGPWVILGKDIHGQYVFSTERSIGDWTLRHELATRWGRLGIAEIACAMIREGDKTRPASEIVTELEIVRAGYIPNKILPKG